MNRRSFILGAGSGALTVVSTRAAAAVNIAEVLPFAGADNVRIEVRTDSAAAIAGLELAGRIEPWAGGPVLWAGAVGQVDVPAGGTANLKGSGLAVCGWPSTGCLREGVTMARKLRLPAAAIITLEGTNE